jgi:hypothetical protein
MKLLTLIIVSNRPKLIHGQATYLNQAKTELGIDKLIACPDPTFEIPPGWRILTDAVHCPTTRVQKALEATKTPFVKICSDDDLVFFPWLEKGIQKLLLEKDLLTCQGISYSYGIQRSDSSCESVFPSYMCDSAAERVVQMLANYGHFTYGIHRTDALRQALNDLLSSTTLPLGGGCFELGLALFIVLQGKVLYMEEPALLREPSPTRGWFEDLVLMDQGPNMRRVLEKVHAVLNKKNEAKNILCTINDLLLWLQYFIFKDTWGFDDHKKKYLAIHSTKKNLPRNLQTIKVSPEMNQYLLNIIKTKASSSL